jgi:hypothetical protein
MIILLFNHTLSCTIFEVGTIQLMHIGAFNPYLTNYGQKKV